MTNLEINYKNFDLNNNKHIEQKAEAACNIILSSIDSNYPSYKIFSYKDSLEQAEISASYAEEITEKFTDLIVISMGGSCLNPQSLISLADKEKSNVNIHFLHNTDPYFLEELLVKINLKKCAILSISNSGTTLETLALTGTMIAEFEKAGIDDIGRNFYFITNINSGNLRDIAVKIKGTIIQHTPNISGRYSGLTNVSTLIAQIAGVDVVSYLEGANETLKDFLHNQSKSSSALSASAIYKSQKTISINMGYLQKFDIFLEWYSQIIAESLGKSGHGITPLRGLGPNDQHSMLQLYLDGPKDKIYSLFYVKNLPKSNYNSSKMKELGYISSKNLTDINYANFEATFAALSSTGAPTRSILLPDLSARFIGELVMHSMLETIILGHMMEINPFNQPGVELIKTESKKIVGGESKLST